MWHSLKGTIESQKSNFGIIKMVCPPKRDRKSRTEKPVFLVYASKEDRDAVGQKLLELVKKDIHYEEDRIQKTLEYQMQSQSTEQGTYLA